MSLKLGTVYRITCDVADVVYIGSTMRSPKKRLWEHRSDSKAWAAGKSSKYCSIFPYMIEHGAEHFRIEPIKQYRVVDARHLRVYETLCIKRAHGACNHNEPFQIRRLWNRKNYRTNHAQILEQQRQYRAEITARGDCECGSHYTQSNRSRHMRSQKHQRWAAEQ